MNTFGSYLLPPYTCDSAKDADEMQALFEHPQMDPLPTEPTYTNLTPSHSESALPTVLTGTLTSPLNPMSMFHASKGVSEVWDHFLQKNAQGRNSVFHVADYYLVCAISPYFMLHPTEPNTWFITRPGTAGKDNPSAMSRLIMGTPLHLEDISVCTHTSALEFHIYHCVLGLPFLCQGVYTFYYTNPHIFTCETIPRSEDPVSTIIAIPDYHTSEAGWHLSIQPNTFNQIIVPGYLILPSPLVTFGNIGRRRRSSRRRRSRKSSSIGSRAVRMISGRKWQGFSRQESLAQVDKERMHISRFLQHGLYAP